jgi:limonene-1,2-epoxide hydrolase
MATPKEIAEQCWRGIHEGRRAEARSLMADDMKFRGPIDTFDNPDDYVAALERLSAIVKGADIEAVIADGNEVAYFYLLKTVVADAPVAEWYTVDGGKIIAIRAYFDARPFAPPSGGHG